MFWRSFGILLKFFVEAVRILMVRFEVVLVIGVLIVSLLWSSGNVHAFT